MTYARSRLWLGISGVGFWVALSVAALWWDWPSRLFPAPANTLREEGIRLGKLAAGYIALSAPFDVMGGYWLPRRAGRPARSLVGFLGSWMRAVFLQSGILWLAWTTLLVAGRQGGRVGVLTAASTLMLMLLTAQGPLARLIGGWHVASVDLSPYRRVLASWGLQMPPIEVVDATDSAFVGGFIGLPGSERLIVPAAWCEGTCGAADVRRLPVGAVSSQIARRIGVLQRGSRWRGVVLAMSWNLLGLFLTIVLTGSDVATIAGLLTLGCGFTVWSFLGLLVLPSCSRAGVFEGDAFAAEHGAERALLENTMSTLDRWQDDEPARPALVEMIFHPVPSVRSRIRRLLERRPPPRGAWQAARIALFLSWGCLGLLSRAVHCNSGRPELWVLFPGD